MNIEDYIGGNTEEEKVQEVQPAKKDPPAEDYGPTLKTLPARSRNITCGMCRKKLKPSEKYWCQTAETSSYWWCLSCIKP